MSSIFTSYRRRDTGGHAGRLYDRLLHRFDAEDLFYDQSGIESGEYFPTEIQNALNSAQVVLVVIGPDWLSTENFKRLDDEKDFVRREILQALYRKEHEIETAPRVVPVLVGGALQPAESDLPEALRPLAFLQSHSICGNFDDYNRQAESLCNLISRDSSNWVAKNSLWLQECLAARDLSYANFGQDISVLNLNSRFIQRKAADTAMSDWWADWKESRKPFVLLGEEGDGKSWAFAFWLAKKASDPDFDIPIVFIPAFRFSVTDRKGIEDAIIDALERTADTVPKQHWQERLQYLLQAEDGDMPQCILVVDGLNERPSLDWRAFFDSIMISPFLSAVAVMVTCRSVYWKEHLASAFDARTTSWVLPPFDDSEMDEALARLNYSRNDFSPKVLELVAKPRYFDLAIRLRAQLEKAGDDITVERLIYEDWRDLTSRKRGLNAPMSHDEFLGLISDLVGRYGDRISIGSLGNELAGYGDEAAIKAELLSTGILTQKAGKFVVSQKPLVLGLGLLLANEIEEIGEAESKEIEEIIAARTEPHSDMDLKVQIKAMALCHALLTETFPETGRLALFRSWVHGRNLDETDMERICSYLPLRPETFFRMAEEAWKRGYDNHQAQDMFMVSFLRYGHIERVLKAMIPVFEKWLGYVHPYGFWGYFKKEQEERDNLRLDVEKRLGSPAIAGRADLYGYSFEVVDDQNMLRLSQVAISVISHFDRQPFVKTLITGIVATAIMGGSHTEFEWIIRTASRKVRQELYQEAQRLIGQNEETSFNAADRLLFAICSEESVVLRESIPDEYSITSWKKEFYKDDTCDSAWSYWDEEKYLEYLERTKLPPLGIAGKMCEVALNPCSTLSENFIDKFSSAIHQIDLSLIRSNIGQMREDSDLRDIEPALCAYCPSQYVEVIRTLVKTLPERNAFSRRMLALKLYEHMPVFGETECHTIQDIWRTSLLNQDKEDDDAETILFPIAIFDRPALEQFALLNERKGKTTYLGEHKPRFRPFEAGMQTIVEKTLAGLNVDNSEEYYTALWYLQKSLTNLDEWLLQKILTIFAEGDSVIRYCCMEIICQANNHSAADSIIASGWRVGQGEQCPFEMDWGSILLSRFGQTLPFTELVVRISPKWLGYAVKKRGNKPDELEVYAQLLHTLWGRINNPAEDLSALLRHVKIMVPQNENSFTDDWSIDLNNERSVKMANYTWGGSAGMVSCDDVKKAFDVQAANDEWKAVHEQVLALFGNEKKRGNHWIDMSHAHGNLDALIETSTPFWREWIEPVLTNNAQGQRLLAMCQGLYEGLCAALMNHVPETGIALLQAIIANRSTRLVDSLTGIRYLYFDLILATDSPQILHQREEMLNGCYSDKALFEIIYLAQWCGKTEWINAVITRWIESDSDYDIARGLRSLGFSNDAEHGRQIQSWIDEHGRSWLMDVARDALKSHKRNSWAHTWFERFVEEDDRVKAWAAFRLFLRCVDKRFWIWGDKLIADAADFEGWKNDAYLANIGAIKDAIKENEKKLKETFISQKVNENQLWPWMKRYIY